MAVDLKFKSIEDFEPGRVVDQVDPLRQLQDTRNKLRDLMTKVDRSEDLEGLLEKVLQNTDDLTKLAGELGIESQRRRRRRGGQVMAEEQQAGAEAQVEEQEGELSLLEQAIGATKQTAAFAGGGAAAYPHRGGAQGHSNL